MFKLFWRPSRPVIRRSNTVRKRDDRTTNGNCRSLILLGAYYLVWCVRASIALKLLVVEDFIGFLCAHDEIGVVFGHLFLGHLTALHIPPTSEFLTLRQRYQRVQGMQCSPSLDSRPRNRLRRFGKLGVSWMGFREYVALGSNSSCFSITRLSSFTLI